MTTTETKDTLTLDEALAALPDGDSVHTFLGGFPLIGADWPREKLIDALRESPSVSITGPMAQGMGHGMACRHPTTGGTLFIETRRRTDEQSAAGSPEGSDE